MDQSFLHQQSGIGVPGRSAFRFNAYGYPPGRPLGRPPGRPPGKLVIGHHNRKWPKSYQNTEAFLRSSKVDSDLNIYSLQSFTEKMNPRPVQDWMVPKIETNRNIIGFGHFIRKYHIKS